MVYNRLEGEINIISLNKTSNNSQKSLPSDNRGEIITFNLEVCLLL